jgi:hypothetical protein
MNHYVFLSLTNIKSSVHLHALCHPPPPRSALRTFTPRRDQLVICGQYSRSISPPRSVVLHEKLIVVQLVKRFSGLCGTLRFVTVLTRVQYSTLFLAETQHGFKNIWLLMQKYDTRSLTNSDLTNEYSLFPLKSFSMVQWLSFLPLDPWFAGSNLADSDGFLRAIKFRSTTSSEGK